MRIRSAVLAAATGVALIATSAGLAFSAPSVVVARSGPVQSSGPPGDNGFIKVDDQRIDGIPNNQPHVGCTFHVDFYNYDEGDLFADVNFALQPPTSGPGYTLGVDGNTHVFIGEDPAGGGKDLDASEIYTLSFTGTAHLQGYHVKLTINAQGSQGSDVKHKVFWVSGCEQPPPTTPTPTTPTPTTPTPTTPTTIVVTDRRCAPVFTTTGCRPTPTNTTTPTVPVPTEIPAGLSGSQGPPASGGASPGLLAISLGLGLAGSLLLFAGVGTLFRRRSDNAA
jgi:hypothetical protein